MNLIYYKHHYNDAPPSIKKDETYFYELTLVLSGSLDYQLDGKSVKLNQGDALFLIPNTMRSRQDSNQKANYVSFNFICSEKPPVFPTVIHNALSNEVKLLITCADEIYDKYYQNVFYQIEPILECILRNLSAKIEQIEENPLVIKVKNFINANYSSKITLAEISKSLFFSQSYLELIFKKHTGLSVIQYLNFVRIEKAKLLLAEENAQLKTVAEDTGFSDVNYLVRVFKKTTGQTPLQYKKTMLNKKRVY